MGGWQLNSLLPLSLSTSLTHAPGSPTSLLPPLFCSGSGALGLSAAPHPAPLLSPFLPPTLPSSPPLSPTLPPSSFFSGTTTLTRAHLNSKEGQQDTDPRRTAHSPVETSKFNCQTPVTPRAFQEQAYPEGKCSAGSKDSSGMDSRPGSMKKGDDGAFPRERGVAFHEGAQLGQGLKEGPDAAGAERPKSSVIPNNIRHKFGSHVVDQLVSEEQVSAQGSGGPGRQEGVLGRLIMRPPKEPTLRTEFLQ